VHLERLEVVDFRNHPAVALDLRPGVTVLLGPNGVGKTSLLEAIGYVASLSSHRPGPDSALVRAGTAAAVIRARVVRERRSVLIDVELRPGSGVRGRVNRVAVPRARDLLGIVRAVVFAPEDLALVRGDPEERRRFLDTLAVQRRPGYHAARQDYERILKQRNTLLRSAGGRAPAAAGLATLDVWDEKLARAGAELWAERLRLTTTLAPIAEQAYQELAARPERVDIAYVSSVAEHPPPASPGSASPGSAVPGDSRQRRSADPSGTGGAANRPGEGAPGEGAGQPPEAGAAPVPAGPSGPATRPVAGHSGEPDRRSGDAPAGEHLVEPGGEPEARSQGARGAESESEDGTGPARAPESLSSPEPPTGSARGLAPGPAGRREVEPAGRREVEPAGRREVEPAGPGEVEPAGPGEVASGRERPPGSAARTEPGMGGVAGAERTPAEGDDAGLGASPPSRPRSVAAAVSTPRDQQPITADIPSTSQPPAVSTGPIAAAPADPGPEAPTSSRPDGGTHVDAMSGNGTSGSDEAPGSGRNDESHGGGPAAGPTFDRASETGGGPTGGAAGAVARAVSPAAAVPDQAHLMRRLLDRLQADRTRELERGVTLSGPHRDDLGIGLRGLPARTHASHGEAWSLALALRLAAYRLLASEGEEPILLLDDVFAELDRHRRERVAKVVAAAEQAIVTLAVVEDLPSHLRGSMFHVKPGGIRAESTDEP
jgi:recombinational DNA repair ATPase RecF